MALKSVSLDDKFDLGKDRVFVSGSQAVVRLMTMQKERDRRADLNTAGYITGYRGSPLGGIDMAFWRAKKVLDQHDVVFQPGINEDLAATALWGSQQAQLRGDGKYDGVFGIWYGKGPGVDRSGDVLRHSNLAGTSPNGGVLALMGDDHTCESSTTAHQSELALVDAMIPIFNPAGVQEILDYGITGWALSRYAGTWAGIKCVKDNIESTITVDGSVDRVKIVLPTDFEMPEGGVHIRQFDHPAVQEARLHEVKLPAVLAFLRANALDRVVAKGGRDPKIGVVSTGKSWLDVLQALDELGIDEVKAADLGIRLYKVAVPWPLEPDGIRRFAEGLEQIIVVEEKRSIIETQIKEILYGTANAPSVIGKTDETGGLLFQTKGALDINEIAIQIGSRVHKRADNEDLARAVAGLTQNQARLQQAKDVAQRIPYFCAGCPHNSSTKVPEGSRAYAGIGCHYMAQFMDRKTEGYTQMGGEGANWVGEAPFSTRSHVFQNLGDGTYNHSGSLAIRAAVSAKVNITYKILYNDAVAMTGGQPHDGGNLSPLTIAKQVAAEGAKRVVVVTDEPDKYPSGIDWPAGTKIHHRRELQTVQKELREVPGVTALIYDQTCAAEKRRRRKRGTFPDPDRRVVINELVCEGCGDCGEVSNCVAIQPKETEFGRKRRIDQSSCNKDFSCVNGFCPSFVTVHGAKRKQMEMGSAKTADLSQVPEPKLPDIGGGFGILVTGVGGTGVVTVGAILGMAAHLENKGCGIIDMAGLAQKGGAVTSHVRLATSVDDIKSIRIPAGGADLVLGCDMVVAGGAKVLSSVDKGNTLFVVNTHETYPGDFTRNADFSLPTQRLIRTVREVAGEDRSRFVEANRLAVALLGDALGANMFMLGFAWQLGGLPISSEAIEKAIELNGASVAMNLEAFRWGRLAAHDLDRVIGEAGANIEARPDEAAPETLAAVIDRRADFLKGYQSRRYAKAYRAAVDKIARAEAALDLGDELSRTVAKNLFKLMAYKDEYEVARLYTNGAFEKQLSKEFESWDRLQFHLAPPITAKKDPETGHLQKSVYGPSTMRLFRLLARMRRFRGTWLDVFGRTEERQMERRLVADYRKLIDEVAGALDATNHAAAIALMAYPSRIRGYGHVKLRNAGLAETEKASLLEAFKSGVRIEEAAE